jgi:hypothetical protein
MSKRGLLIEGQTHLPWESVETKPPPNYGSFDIDPEK